MQADVRSTRRNERDEVGAEAATNGRKAKPRKHKRGTKHPGVVLIPPKGRNGWQARYKDPDSGKFKWEAPPETVTNADGREQWAKRKSQQLAKRRAELDGGAPRATGQSLKDAVDRYFAAHPHLRDRTVEGYRGATAKLQRWAEAQQMESGDELSRAALMRFREWLITTPKQKTVTGGKRGQRVDGDKPRGAERVNSEMRKVRTVLGYLSDAQLLPRLNREDLRIALKRLPVTVERVDFLKPVEMTQLLQAALAHDAATYRETRAEHAGQGRANIGTTKRYTPIAPFVAFVLLTGCRFGEALQLDWREVDFDALDHDGKPVGEIHLRGTATKTRSARTVDLAVSPSLRTMLGNMHERSGKPTEGSVFGLSRHEANAAARRLLMEHKAPKRFTWQCLRRTCGTYLTNAPGIFGAASAYRSAKQLGHSVAVAERHYLGLVRGISPSARTLELAMQIDDATLSACS
jgi:integrase